MKQFFYTSCLNGESVSGQSGFQIRAQSSPLSTDESTVCLRALNFKLDLPQNYSGETPVKLLFCRSDRTGSLALQSVWLGEDPVTRRTGNYFSHVLCDLRPEISARTVLEWWKSPSWQTKNEGIEGTELPAPELLSPNPALNDSVFEEMREDAELFQIWEFLISAWWTRTASGRIFAAANQEKFVKALWALCRILPEGLWKNLSFSTYEKDAMLSPANVVGLWNLEKPEESIPQNCFTGTNQACNFFTGQKSSLPQIPRYLNFIIQSVKEGKIDEIDSFHANAPAIIWTKHQSAEMFFELVRHPDSLEITNLQVLSQVPNIGRFVMRNEKRFRLLLENFFNAKLLDLWEDGAIQTTFEPFFNSGETVLEQFREGVHAILWQKILAGDLEFLERFYEKWLPRLTAINLTADDFWGIFNEDPGALPKPVYVWAYPKSFRLVTNLGEPSQQIEFLIKWSFHGDDSRCEPQIKQILESRFPNIVKLELYRKFFETDFGGNDEQFSSFYFSYPQWNIQLLEKLAPETRQEFLNHLVPSSAPALLSVLHERLGNALRKKEIWSEALFEVYCRILSDSSAAVPDAVGHLAQKLPQEKREALAESLKGRSDIEQLLARPVLKLIFDGAKPGLLDRILGWFFQK